MTWLEVARKNHEGIESSEDLAFIVKVSKSEDGKNIDVLNSITVGTIMSSFDTKYVYITCKENTPTVEACSSTLTCTPTAFDLLMRGSREKCVPSKKSRR